MEKFGLIDKYFKPLFEDEWLVISNSYFRYLKILLHHEMSKFVKLNKKDPKVFLMNCFETNRFKRLTEEYHDSPKLKLIDLRFNGVKLLVFKNIKNGEYLFY